MTKATGSLLALLLSGCCTFSARGYRGPPSEHFDGERFFNRCATHPEQGAWGLLSWVLAREPGPWPEVIDGPSGAMLRRTLYQWHLPLKRWCWRAGLLEAAEGRAMHPEAALSRLC